MRGAPSSWRRALAAILVLLPVLVGALPPDVGPGDDPVGRAAERERSGAADRERAGERQRQSEETRVQEETRRDAALQEAEAALERAKEEAAANPKAQRLARSAALCYWAAVRSVAKDEIATEQRYAREGGGVVNNAKLYAQQQRMRRADETSGRLRKNLKGSPLSCKDKTVAISMYCLAAAREESEIEEQLVEVCKSLEMGLLIDLAGRIESGEVE